MPAGHLTHRQLIHHWPELGSLFRSPNETAEYSQPTNHPGSIHDQGEYDANIETMSTEELISLIEDIIARLEMA